MQVFEEFIISVFNKLCSSLHFSETFVHTNLVSVWLFFVNVALHISDVYAVIYSRIIYTVSSFLFGM